MAVVITLRLNPRGDIISSAHNHELASTPIEVLPLLERLQADPFSFGKILLAALGGNALVQQLDADPERLLLLDLDSGAEGIAWEFAALPDHQLLVAQYGCLRLIDRPASPSPSGTLNFVALAADPLVDVSGAAREGYRLKLEDELRAIRETLAQSNVALEARRIPPTIAELRRALRRGPTVLHLTCHGGVISANNGPMAVLSLEDEDGKLQPLLGRDLAVMSPRGALRMVLLSASKTAEGRTDSMARALVWQGVPFVVGMQSTFPDPLSDTVATAFYDTLLIGQPLDVALQRARQALSADPSSLGLLVGYTAIEGWHPIPLQPGTPLVGRLGLFGDVRLTSEVQPPSPLLGRNSELHQLAQIYSSGHKVVTICGTGGIGKTALAATFAERFGWRWPHGVRAISFGREMLNAREFRAVLLRELLGVGRASILADLGANDQDVAILQAMRDWDGLLLLDSYEALLQAIADDDQPGHAEASAIHRLVTQLAVAGVALLLTSRQQPVQLAGEVLFPGIDEPLGGLQLQAAAQLFIHHSARVKEQDRVTRRKLAKEVAVRTNGHPLAIVLLAGEYDTHQASVDDFLASWADELSKARHPGIGVNNVTFTKAFERSYNHLTENPRHKLRLLSIFQFPFYIEGAALMWGFTLDDVGLSATREAASGLLRCNLLEVDGHFAGGAVSTYRFQPAVRQEIARRILPEEHELQTRGFCAYGEWLARRGYGDIYNEPALAQRVRLSLDALDAAIHTLTGTDQLWHIKRVAWLKKALGQTHAAYDLLLSALSTDQSTPDPQVKPEAAKVDCSLRCELADVCVTLGDLDQAMKLYGQSLAVEEQLGDLQGKSATLHAMANVWVTRGELERAMELYGKLLVLQEQLGDLQGKANTLRSIANVWVTRGELERAMELYGQSLAVDEQVGDLKGKSATLHQMANVWVTRGELERAMELYGQSLATDEQLGDLQGKANTLRSIANVWVTRGELERAMELYGQSLATDEQLGDLQGRSITLANMANVWVTRGELERAMELYGQSLAVEEQLGDLQGKSATLHAMANVWVTRGELERAMELYRQSLAIKEQVGDLKGKSATLHQMANVWVTRGELERAMELYRQSLAIKEQVGDLQGKSATLDMIANVCMARDEWEQAENSLTEALALARRVGDRQGIAFKTVKLGQVAQARGDQAHALAAYQEGLEIFQNLGMPGEAEQVRQMIADLQGTASSPPDPLKQMLADARAASQRGDPATAVATQEQAVAFFRERLAAQEGGSRDEQVTLSVLLYNLAGYYGEVERHADAVCALEEVVALDERTSHPDLVSDRQALETARRMATLSPEERARLQQVTHPATEPDAPVLPQQPGASSNAYLAQLREQLAALPPEQRAEAEAAVHELTKHLSGMTPEQQDQYLRSLQDAQRRQKIESLADQARDGAIAALRGETPKDELIANMEDVATQAAEGEQPGSPWAELALYLCALVALLRGEHIPPVPVAYAAHIAAIQAEICA